MNNRYLALVGLFIAGFLSQPNSAMASTDAVEPYPLEYWALRSVINNAQISPDGKYLGIQKIPNKDGNPIIEVYEASNLDKEPFRFNADPMEITTFSWASDNHIIVSLRQKVRDQIDGFNQGVYDGRIVIVNVDTKKIKTVNELNPSIESVLPQKPGKVILSFNEGGEDGPGAKLSEPFRPRAYWEYDLDSGRKKLLIRGTLVQGNIDFNGKGEPWLARGFDIADGEFVWYLRRPGESGWEEFHRLHEDSFDDFFVMGFDDTKQGNLMVIGHFGQNTNGLYSFNPDTGQTEEQIFISPDVDVWNISRHSNFWQYPDKITGVAYATDKIHYAFFDEIEEATYEQLKAVIPFSHNVSVTARSRDGQSMTILNTGPQDPGTYYMLKDGEFKSVGSRQPLLESEKLARMEYHTFEARDGEKIRAYVTVPHGEPPFPTIVLPHGGPFVSELVIYDEWSQMLANNGYMVVQPQYRGSFNYGMKFHKISFENGGQGGYKMQDDKDDSALYLVKEGLADPDRLAMFGWSYGGYAALVAASRTPQIYQCTIAGAAVADMIQQINYYRWALRGSQKTTQLSYREGSINPIEEVAKVNVPILLIHGDVDQRVPVTHADKYRKELDKHNKYYKYVELEGADHFSNTLFYNHQIELYESMIDFLDNDCGNISKELQASN
ncbi:MAG: prolyl oligopeptidase family serine peptidase [Pseudomonadota bacterium]